MNDGSLIQFIEKQTWMEEAAGTLSGKLAEGIEASGEMGQVVEDFLHGRWLGHALHPVLTDIPIGAWNTALLLDVLEMSGRREMAPGADAAITLGLVGAAGAAVTGLADWRHTEGRPRRIGLAHAMLNVSSTLLYASSLALRKRDSRAAGRALAILGWSVSNVAAYLGGHLVDEARIGVNRSHEERLPDDFVAVASESDLEEGRPVRVEAKGFPVLLVRRGERVLAIGETCAHLGGPLSEGTIDGDTVTCPWHGSRFSLIDGKAQTGPTAYDQPCFEVRILDGQVEVRPADHPEG